METSRPQPTEAEWLQRKPALRKLYLMDEVSLKRLVAEADKMDLVVTVAQMEYKLKLWGFRRNIDKPTWVSIDGRIAKRKAMGKESEVIYCGKRLKPSTVEKATNRYRDMSISAQRAPALSPPPTSPVNNEVTVCTPPPLPMEFEWPRNLPWFKFKSISIHFMTKHDGNVNQNFGSIRLLQSVKTQALLPMVLGVTPGLTLTESQPQVSQLAAKIGISMPESFPGENLQRAQVLINGSSEEYLQECWSVLFYNLSNNLSDLFEKVQWNVLMDLLHEYRVLNLKIDLQNLQDATIQGFMQTIFRASIYHILHYQASGSARSEALEVVTWLLSSGHNPNNRLMIPYLNYDIVTPLQAAILGGNLDLMEQLLKAGADANLVLDHGSGGSANKLAANTGRRGISGAIVPHPPLELSLRIYRHGSEVAVHMARLLLKHGASENLDRALQLAILRGETQIAMEIAQQGANPAATMQNPYGFLYEETSVSAAASAGLSETKFIIDLLRSQYPSKPTADFLSADVFVSAAAEGQDDTIRYLHSINPNGIASNFHGVTPLHAAARKGRLGTCQLLMNLQGYYPYTSTQPSPLHLASYGGHIQVVQLFLNNGANVDDVVTLQNPQEQGRFIKRYDLYDVHFSTPCHLTPLQLLLTIDESTLRVSTSSKQLSCAITLIKAGARLTGFEVVSAVKHLHPDLLTAALAAGGDPNWLFGVGLPQVSALQMLFTDRIKTRSTNMTLRKAQIADMLLKHDAQLLGGEVTLAIRSGDRYLIDLLLGSGGSLKDSVRNGMKCLEAAILYKDPDTIKRVIDDDSTTYDGGALCAAVQMRMHSVTKRLLQLRPEQEKTTIYDITALGLAAQLGDLGLFQTLSTLFTFSNVAKLPFVLGDGILMPAEGINKPDDNNDRAWWRWETSVEGSPLALAVMSRDIEVVGELLRRGFEPDWATWTTCEDLNDLAMVQTLFNHGKKLGDCEPRRNALVRSPLHSPIQLRNKALVILMLEAGADVNEHNLDFINGRSPLQLAIELGDLDIAECLLQAKADVNAPPASNGGATALQLAAIKGHLGLAKHLLDLGADIDAPPALMLGRTALEGAAEYGRIDMLAFLLGHGALTTGPGRLQYIRSVKLASRGGYSAAVDLLVHFRDWSEEDEALMNDQNLLDNIVSYRFSLVTLRACDLKFGSS